MTFVLITSKNSASGYKNRADNEAEEIMKDRKTDKGGQERQIHYKGKGYRNRAKRADDRKSKKECNGH